MANIGVRALSPAGFIVVYRKVNLLFVPKISRESDTRAVCGSEEFEPPPTHKGPQRGAFIVNSYN